MRTNLTLIILLYAVALLLAFYVPAHAQTTDQQFSALGMGFNQTDAGRQAAGWMAYARPLTESGLYSVSMASLVSSKPTTVETGVMQRVWSVGPLSLFALGVGGAALGQDSFGASYSGGVLAAMDISRWVKGAKIVVGSWANKTALSDVRPALNFGFAWGF